MLTKEELLILAVAATDGQGEYCVSRDYNKPWGEQCAAMKHLEDLGFMKNQICRSRSSEPAILPSISYHRCWPCGTRGNHVVGDELLTQLKSPHNYLRTTPKLIECPDLPLLRHKKKGPEEIPGLRRFG